MFDKTEYTIYLNLILIYDFTNFNKQIIKNGYTFNVLVPNSNQKVIKIITRTDKYMMIMMISITQVKKMRHL